LKRETINSKGGRVKADRYGSNYSEIRLRLNLKKIQKELTQRATEEHRVTQSKVPETIITKPETINDKR
jgi:hypothetical protein